jgi:hypothetical protein
LSWVIPAAKKPGFMKAKTNKIRKAKLNRR